ncbi:S4 domain protein YaaA [Weissella beninensis]|uniref:S4 domain-containing protein YaaA n=1 Tax=Periweissella beninensis TaxID=504936 RepID=A0ABT0VKJ4_9LACO|nr:S4 domain-containing protein YaaA [Periweissella beninensis]MBM7544733.1 S4 domain protein YaaA [Periweissella beninensis]MCM2436975.1 S4 domain-containing protein YaaA [Periweissella beninensis]
MKTEVFINTPFITLGQLLKEENVISSGGQAKWFLKEVPVMVNEEHDDRRGRKLYPDDIVNVPEIGTFIVKAK